MVPQPSEPLARNRLTKTRCHASVAIGLYPGAPTLPSRAVNVTTIPANYRLRMPGPAAVPERVRAACALPVLSHRGAEFRAVVRDVTRALRGILGTKHDVFLLGTSGTGGMEAALVNVLSVGD